MLIILDIARSLYGRIGYLEPVEPWKAVEYESLAWPPGIDLSKDTPRGERIYIEKCAVCHGGKGKGDGPAAVSLIPRPRDFTTGDYKYQSTPAGTQPTDIDLARTVRDGLPGSAMPYWKGILSSADIGEVVAYIKQFSNKFVSADPPTLKTQIPIASTPESIDRGLELYTAKGGAKIVSWSENPVMIRKKDEAAFIERGKQLAKKEEFYLALNYSINLGTDPKTAPDGKIWSTRVVIVGPNGEVLSKYRKTILVPGYEASIAVGGNDKATVIDTPYGRLTSLICFDNDFPSFVRKQVGKEGTDILLDPSGDWKAIDPYHTQMTAFRAIENGFSVVRVTGLGLSAVYDYQGRALAAMDYFKTNDKVFTAHVPERGVRTLYSLIGDVFAWLAVFSLIILIGRAVRRR